MHIVVILGIIGAIGMLVKIGKIMGSQSIVTDFQETSDIQTTSTFKSTEVQNKFGTVIDKAQIEPVLITKYDRPFAVMISSGVYEKLYNAFLILTAREAEEEGCLSAEQSRKLLDSL